jgi:hypothetical protein
LATLPGAAVAAPQANIADIDEEVLAQYDVRAYPGEWTVFLAQPHLAGYHEGLGGSVHSVFSPLIQ